MPTRNISLTDYYDQFVDNHLKQGRYQNASEVVRAGLAALEWRERYEQLKLKRLKDAIEQGERDIAEGRYISLESDEDISDFFAQIDREIDSEVSV